MYLGYIIEGLLERGYGVAAACYTDSNLYPGMPRLTFVVGSKLPYRVDMTIPSSKEDKRLPIIYVFGPKCDGGNDAAEVAAKKDKLHSDLEEIIENRK